MPNDTYLSHAQLSRTAIQKLYVNMKHLFFRGQYKPLGMSGADMIKALKELNPEIYGDMQDDEKVDLSGLLYIFQRLPIGIEECRYINLISREGLENSSFKPILPNKRRRNCYRIDEEQMFIEMTRGRSDIYDILTHLTFMFIESQKIRHNALSGSKTNRAWQMIEKVVTQPLDLESLKDEAAISYLSVLLGRTYDETAKAVVQFTDAQQVNDLFHICYWLGKLSMDDPRNKKNREITFSATLRHNLGSHEFGEKWASKIKSYLHQNDLLNRPIHIISANIHGVMNSVFGKEALKDKVEYTNIEDLAEKLSQDSNQNLRNIVAKKAKSSGMHQINDVTGTNISVQIFDFDYIDDQIVCPEIKWNKSEKNNPVVIVMDYAFGEQAFETMDELLKPHDKKGSAKPLNIQSVNIMGKAGILEGNKGDIMIPTAHIFEGSTDNYPFENDFAKEEFEGLGLGVYDGPMITVLGTSLQNRVILKYFQKSWKMIGLEMEGAHYQKAIQIASKIRKSVSSDIKVRYAYYASDNPLETGGTLASGSLGLDGVKPTYIITTAILNRILG